MKKYILIPVIFILGLIVFKYWIDTQLIIHDLCGHTNTVKARIIGELKPVYCYLEYPDGSIGCHSFIKNCNIGEVVEIKINNYSCDDFSDSF